MIMIIDDDIDVSVVDPIVRNLVQANKFDLTLKSP